MRFDNATALGKHLREAYPDHLAPVYVVLCAEEGDRKRVFQGVVAALTKGAEAQVSRFSGEERGVSVGLQEASALSLFGERKVVVVDGIDKASKEEIEALRRFIARPPKEVFLVLGASQVRPIKGLIEGGEREMVVLDLLKEKPWERTRRKEQWLVGQAKRSGKALSKEALDYLFREVGEELDALDQEVSKLITYVGERPQITLADAERLCSGGAKPKLWKVAEEVVWDRNRSVAGAVESAADLFMLFPQVRSQLQTGLKLHDCLARGEDIKAALPRAFPKTLEKYQSLVRTLPANYFRSGLRALFECELMAKNSSHTPEFIWETLCCRLFAWEAYALSPA